MTLPQVKEQWIFRNGHTDYMTIANGQGIEVLRSKPVPSPRSDNNAFLRPWIYVEKGKDEDREFERIPLESFLEYEDLDHPAAGSSTR